MKCEISLKLFIDLTLGTDVEFSWHVVLEFPVRMSSFLDIVNNPK